MTSNTPNLAIDPAFWVFPQEESSSILEYGGFYPSTLLKDTAHTCLPTGQTFLSGVPAEALHLGTTRSISNGSFNTLENGHFQVGWMRMPADSSQLEALSFDAYQSLLQSIQGYQLCRIWNYVPDINHQAPGRIENYQLFCLGRARAFASHYGQQHSARLPAASATGCNDHHLTIVFLACRGEVHHWENPQQVPAYAYPRQYSPLPPSFARASRCHLPNGREWTFVSGTAAIKGHQSLCIGDFDGQLELAFENIEITLNQAGLGLSNHPKLRKHFKVFLRQRENLPLLEERLQAILSTGDTFTVVQADICRQELDVEIELSLLPTLDSPAR